MTRQEQLLDISACLLEALLKDPRTGWPEPDAKLAAEGTVEAIRAELKSV